MLKFDDQSHTNDFFLFLLYAHKDKQKNDGILKNNIQIKNKFTLIACLINLNSNILLQ